MFDMELIVVSGWTGAGKSTMANELAARVDGTVISFDWVMSGLRVFDDVWSTVELPLEHQRSVGWSLMGRVIEQQLRRGASVVADLVAREAVVIEWRALAQRYGANFSVVECICSDAAVHRERVEGRQRNIPGWYELTWERVQQGRAAYPPLPDPKLTLDSIDPLESNVETAMQMIRTHSDLPSFVVRRFFESMQARDWASAERCLDANIVVRFTETNEVFRGANFLAFQRAYPDGWTLTVEEVIGCGNRVASQTTVDQDGVRYWCAGFYTVTGGKIIGGVEHWVTEGATTPPPWRLEFTQ
jgi:predicted kinase